MPPDLMFWGGVAIKMAITALFVSAATITAEKLGAAVGALVATLPVSAGPVYVFLALDHDAAFISASALASLALNAATAIYVTVYVLLAQRHGVLVSVPLALAAWFAAALLFGPVHWAAWAALVLNLVIFVLCFFIVERYGHVRMPPTKRTWYGFMIRGGMWFACRRGADVEFSYRSCGQRHPRSVSSNLHEYYGDPTWSGRRTCYRSSVGERYTRPCRLRHGIADVASDSSAARFGQRSPHRALRIGRMERHAVRTTAPTTQYLNSQSNVRYWHKADISSAPHNVRFRG